MLDLKKYKADISDEVTKKGMVIEFWAKDEDEAKEKLYWLIGKNYSRNYYDLQEIGEEAE
ncbi:hypothetical protein SAMN04487977_101492 [Treponema bryantii]|uniref:Uncharacterized protein n=1 Tax=Treponema bryantii TaxID=163 RepID=A0A1H9AWW1_9SPIR|nr:hypothetical protein [Treponema bryantii]SEP80977.1 hypothetical protein SAMN04487977_101492 [Treponema bryantii]